MSGVRNLYNKITPGFAFSLDETDTGTTWLDGKKIYRKVLNAATLPNTTTKQVPHGIQTIAKVTALYGFTKSTTTYLVLPHADTTLANNISLTADKSFITIGTGADRTAFKDTYLVIEFLKS